MFNRPLVQIRHVPHIMREIAFIVQVGAGQKPFFYKHEIIWEQFVTYCTNEWSKIVAEVMQIVQYFVISHGIIAHCVKMRGRCVNVQLLLCKHISRVGKH